MHYPSTTGIIPDGQAPEETTSASDRLLRGCELHMHILGAFYADDVLALGRDRYRTVDWQPFRDHYRAHLGADVDPIAIFDAAVRGDPDGFARLARLHTYTAEDGGDFGRWEAKFDFFMAIWSTYRRQREAGDRLLLGRMLDRYRAQGLDYVEYRCGSGMDTPGFRHWHHLCARILRDASCAGMTARYIVSLPRWAPLEGYQLLRGLLADHPEIAPAIVGVDFASVEEGFPPKGLRPVFAQVARDNRADPATALDVVCHVGESYFDKSLESAIRWCHELAEMGARRLGHAIALGLDPAVAVARRPGAHERELVSERLDQIAYELHHHAALSTYSAPIDVAALVREREALVARDLAEEIERPYDAERLDGVRGRQRFVLDRLVALGTVIESCPTSNMRIGGVPDPAHHPIHRFLASGVNLAICTDDPGNFAITLSSEIDWVLTYTGYDEVTLQRRLGDPRRFRLGQQRTHATQD
jgi:hypothetical protein